MSEEQDNYDFFSRNSGEETKYICPNGHTKETVNPPKYCFTCVEKWLIKTFPISEDPE